MMAIGVALLCSALACKQNAKAPPVAPHSALADSADQVMYGVRFVLTKEGVQQAALQADTGYFFDQNTRIELRGVRTTFFRTTGVKDAVLTSREGTYNTRRHLMEARGNADIVTTDGRRLRTEQVRFDQDKNEIASDSAYTLTEASRRMTGIGFTSDPNMNQMKCLRACGGFVGEVNVPTASPATPGAAPVRPGSHKGTFKLPGQP
jgi:LPS export ABC transporter protein LptC